MYVLGVCNKHYSYTYTLLNKFRVYCISATKTDRPPYV